MLVVKMGRPLGPTPEVPSEGTLRMQPLAQLLHAASQ